mmetsp:Transcript_24888/g.25254  ORF Transcript_24888/g.25254 Transcript_24888/m.25254 type:complete len:383 (+) Transcript_24888:195-1343(+)
MSRHKDNVEVSLDGVNDIECNPTHIAHSKQTSIVEDCIKNVLKLNGNNNDENDNENENYDYNEKQQIFRQSIKKEIERPQQPACWPQRPLMIRPTPFSSTKIIGVRTAMGDNYENFPGICAGCILPINNGREIKYETLVVDFESNHFIGTLLLRIKQVPQLESDETAGKKNTRDYFANRKRRFQAVVKGCFRTPLSMSRCITGQLFDRSAGPLPARWIVKSIIKFISILAPQLNASLDGNKPRFLTPLVATAQTVVVENNDVKKDADYRFGSRLKIDAEVDLVEPSSIESTSILSDLRANSSLGISIPDTTESSPTSRMSVRKKIFNTLAADKLSSSSEPRFSMDKVYTFEFFQVRFTADNVGYITSNLTNHVFLLFTLLPL